MKEEQAIERIEKAISRITQPREDGIGVAWSNRGAAVAAWNEIKAILNEDLPNSTPFGHIIPPRIGR